MFIWPISEHSSGTDHSPSTVLGTGGKEENKADRNHCPDGTSSGERRKQMNNRGKLEVAYGAEGISERAGQQHSRAKLGPYRRDIRARSSAEPGSDRRNH